MAWGGGYQCAIIKLCIKGSYLLSALFYKRNINTVYSIWSVTYLASTLLLRVLTGESECLQSGPATILFRSSFMRFRLYNLIHSLLVSCSSFSGIHAPFTPLRTLFFSGYLWYTLPGKERNGVLLSSQDMWTFRPFPTLFSSGYLCYMLLQEKRSSP